MIDDTGTDAGADAAEDEGAGTAEGHGGSAAEAREPARPPDGHEEKVIAEVWSEFLGIPDPPANVSFFELGGYSLTLMRVGGRLQHRFGLVIPMPELFESTTIAAQAALVEGLYDDALTELTD
ncbi:acyl carrier protein [Actinomadura sp. GTD37]|uniref:acyl carrier protein n=1 Tax=Actinomadura sp. GTD37 TaxID=1778030 RepID=UPI0035C166B3